jgi:outer membrane protein assembly factor BamB
MTQLMETQSKIKLVSNLINISGIFCLAVGVLLLLNFWNIKSTKPLESEALKSLITQFQNDPQNESLKNEVRNLDLLARKAYFTSNWQIKTGSFLLLFGGILFTVLLRIYHNLKARIGEPVITGTSNLITRTLSRRWILATGGLLLCTALAASFLTTDYLKIYEETGQVVQAVPQETEQTVRTIAVEEKRVTSDTVNSDTVNSDIVTDGQPTADSRQQELLTNSALQGGDRAGLQGGDRAGLQGGDQPEAGVRAGPGAGPASSHPSFRGFWSQGVSQAKNLPVDWDGPSGRNIKWKVPLPKKGYNSPVIWGDRLFITGADVQSRVLYCFDRHTGNLLWQHDASGIPGSPAAPPRVTGDTGLAAPGAATDGSHVAVIFATGDILACDMNGNRLWAKNLGVPDNHYGHSSSLVCWKGKLIVQYDTNTSGRLMALNISTGETFWETTRKTKISWASPVLAEIDGKLQVITVTSPTVYGNDFESGSLIWSLDCLSGEVGPSVAFYDGLVYAANEYARMVAIKPGSEPKIVWETDEYLPEAASPVAAEGLLFVATSYGVFACYDARTGSKRWEVEYSQGFYGSPMIADGKVYVMDRGGTMHIFKLSPEKTSLGDPVLGEKSVVTPAFADGTIYINGDKNLLAIETTL